MIKVSLYNVAAIRSFRILVLEITRSFNMPIYGFNNDYLPYSS